MRWVACQLLILSQKRILSIPRSATHGYTVRSSDTVSASPLSPIRIPGAGTVFTAQAQARNWLPHDFNIEGNQCSSQQKITVDIATGEVVEKTGLSMTA